MTTLIAGQKDIVELLALQALTLIGGALADVRVWPVAGAGYTPVAASETVIVGPFSTTRLFSVECLAGSVTFGQAAVDFPTMAEVIAAGNAIYQPIMTNDVLELFGAGAPVDYTDGTPPAMGEGLAGIGSRYTNITVGDLYVNVGTKAHPTWSKLAFAIV